MTSLKYMMTPLMNHVFKRVENTELEQQKELRQREVFPYYQPIIEVASGCIHSFEALARTLDVDGNIQSAGKLFFDPTISDINKLELDQRVRRQAVTQARWLPANTRLTINISPEWISSIHDDGAIPTLQMIYNAGLDPSRVVIELTELKGDIHRIQSVVRRYRQAGLLIAIDDFGAGFSQLDRVIALEPDIIKLDMQLFKQALKGGIAKYVVKSLVELSTKCGARIVCEGVETEEDFHFGLKCGAGYMQGYLFAPASQQFLSVDTFASQVRQLRERFFAQICHTENHKNACINRIKDKVLELRSILLTENTIHLSSLQANFQGPAELLRFYICDINGNQVSANYNFTPEAQVWESDTTPIGYNWSWRPYFFKLMALKEHKNTLFSVSDSYQDQSSEQLCITLTTFIDDKRLLLVDIINEWD